MYFLAGAQLRKRPRLSIAPFSMWLCLAAASCLVPHPVLAQEAADNGEAQAKQAEYIPGIQLFRIRSRELFASRICQSSARLGSRRTWEN